jgi:RNA polymerase sigma-70 factor (ECF subfamily)
MSQDPAEPQDWQRDTFELLNGYRAGDEAALDKILERYQHRVARVVSTRLGSWLRTRVEVDDVTQEVLLRVALNLDEYEHREEASLLDWIAGIVENQIRVLARHHRRQKRDPEREISSGGDRADNLGDVLPSETRGPATRVEAQDDEILLYECLDQLEELDRELIVMREMMGGSWEFVAEKLGLTSGNSTRKAYLRARTRLAAKLLGRNLP